MTTNLPVDLRENSGSSLAFLAALLALVLLTTCTLGPERRWNEDQAFTAIKLIRSAEADLRFKDGKYGSLKDLADAGLIDSQLASGIKNGYRFEIKVNRDAFEATASPLKHGRTGTWYYYLDQSGVIRGGVDGPVSAQDDPIGNQ